MTWKMWLHYLTGTRLTSIIRENNASLLKELLLEKKYFSPDYVDPDYNDSPLLYYATNMCRFACVAELLVAGAAVNCRETEHNLTPLHTAIAMEHFAAVPLLLYWHADHKICVWGRRPIDHLRDFSIFLLSDENCSKVYRAIQKFQKTLPNLRQEQTEAKQAYQQARCTKNDMACFNAELLKAALRQYIDICDRLYEVVNYEKTLMEGYQTYLPNHKEIAQDYLSSCQEGLVYFVKEALPYHLILLRHLSVFLEIAREEDPDKVDSVRERLITRIEKLCDHLSAEPNADCEEARRLLQQERDRVSGQMLVHQGSFITVSDSGSDTSSTDLELVPLDDRQGLRHRSVGLKQ